MPRIYTAGGINENNNIDLNECSEGFNFELRLGDTAFRPRPPVDYKDQADLAGEINGIMQLVTRANAETTLVFEDDDSTPTIYEWDGTTFTEVRTDNLATGSKLRDVYWPLDEYLVIVDIAKSTPLMKWNGTTLTRHKTSLVTQTPSANTAITEPVAGTYNVQKTTHGYAVGDLITIAGVTPSTLNGEWEITTVVDPNNFRFQTTAGIGSSSVHGTSALGTEVFAKYGVVHNGRVWVFNVKTDSDDTPHLMAASAFEDPETFDTTTRAQDGAFTGNEAFYMVTPDLKAINGVAVFHDQLVISTDGGKLFRLVGSDSTDYQWVPYYAGSAAIGDESIANIGNDIVYMKHGGGIESLLATDQSGGITADVSTDDLSRFIQTTVKDLTGCKIIYDQKNQKVFFFLDDGRILVLFKHLINSGISPWSVYKTNLTCTDNGGSTVNSFIVNAAKYMKRPGTDEYTVYFGDKGGNIYDLNGVGSGDGVDGSTTINIETTRTTNYIDNLGTKNEILMGNVQYRRIGECELSLIFDWGDEYFETQSDIHLNGPPTSETASYYGALVYYGGEFYYNEGTPFSNKISTKGFSPTGRARVFTMKHYITTKVKFQIDYVSLLDE